MIKLIPILKEMKGNILYHFTDVKNLNSIKSNYILQPHPKRGYVSFTRNKNVKFDDGDVTKMAILILDRDILKNNYKIEPYVDLGYEDGILGKQSNLFQSEERIKGPVDVSKALIGIELPKLKEMKAKPGLTRPTIKKLGNIGMYIDIDGDKCTVSLDRDLGEDMIAIKTPTLALENKVKNFLEKHNIPFSFIQFRKPMFIVKDATSYFQFQ